MCQIALSKSTEKVKEKKEKRLHYFLWRGCMIFLTTEPTVTAVTTVKKKFTFSVILERAI